MLIEPTMEQLRSLRLTAMAHALERQRADPSLQSLSFDERFALLVEHELEHRKNKKLTRALREAKLKFPNACVEDIEPGSRRGLDRAVLRQLASGRWAKDHHSIVITGKTGTGKTYLACAFAQLACRLGLRAFYRRVSKLVHELATSDEYLMHKCDDHDVYELRWEVPQKPLDRMLGKVNSLLDSASATLDMWRR